MRERERLDMNYSIEKPYIINLTAVAVAAVAVAAGFSQLTEPPATRTTASKLHLAPLTKTIKGGEKDTYAGISMS
jgi:hypothetical protein